MLQDFPARFPDSPRKDDATFYLGVAFRQARKFREALERRMAQQDQLSLHLFREGRLGGGVPDRHSRWDRPARLPP